MNKTKWILGLSIAGVMALSGTAFALTSGSVVAQSVGQTLGIAPIVATTQNQGTVADTITTPSSLNNNSNAVATPGSNGNGGGYGMMAARVLMETVVDIKSGGRGSTGRLCPPDLIGDN